MSEKMKTIFDLIMRINEETKYAAFINIGGHVNNLRVFIGKNKEEGYNEWIYNAEFYYTGELESDDMKVKGIVNNLKAILEVQ